MSFFLYKIKEIAKVEKAQPIIAELCLLFMSVIGYWGLQSLNYMPLKSSRGYAVFNVIILYVLYKLVYMIGNRVWIASLVTGLLWFFLGAGNYYVNEFRGVGILPWDFLALGTAADVAGQYSIHFYPRLIIWFIYIVLTSVLAFFFVKKKYKGKNRVIYAAVSLLICILLMAGMMSSEKYKGIPDRLYLVQRYYKTQGIAVSFFNYSKFLHTAKPSGYSIEECAAAVKEYTEADAAYSEDTPLNVICIMNESFADFKSIGSMPEIEECLTYFNSMNDNVVRGNLYVPVYGGSTVNTEYEFLTANSTAFMKGCPFSYAVREDRPSISRLFEDMGYEVHAMHPAAAVNWNRKSVYPYLGMEDFISLEKIENENPDMVNEHTTDAWDYSKIIEMYENKSSDRFFVFNVTMQNHGGYDFIYDDFRQVDLSAYGDYGEEENYFTLLKMSDEAIKELTEYFENVDEHTMILIFGDHQPKLGNEFLNILHGSEIDESDPEKSLIKYVTPFMIWANYDIEEKYIDKLSVNYLSELLLETANVTLPEYYQQQKALREEYPVLSVNGAINAEGKYMPVSEVENNSDILKYRYLEYNNASEKTSDVLWEAFK